MSDRNVRAAAATALAVLGLAVGCGGEEQAELSATAFRERANAICRENEEAGEQALRGVDRDDPQAMLRATEEAGRSAEKAKRELGDLDGLEASEALVDRFLARADELAETYRSRVEAAQSGDDAAADRAEQRIDQLQEETREAGTAAGLDACVG